ncbi:MAG: hypothetical protein JXB33_11140 [Clostridia bacterium]|nr:hypothetical protein [Clostridia bacterium]
MKKLKDLVPEDFPGVDSAKFEEWKQEQVKAARNSTIVVWGITAAVLIAIFVFDVYGIIPAILAIALIAVSGILINKKANDLARELGITKEMIKKATRN